MNENQNNKGAPSSDDTSALFVSARKKQIAEQEEQRIAAEKEAARLAAEEEVRRLEEEVAQRKKKAEEDAILIQQEEQERRRQAEIEKARIASEIQAQPVVQNPAPLSVAPPPPPIGQVATGSTITLNNLGPNSTKIKIGIAAGAVVFFILLITILVSAFSGGEQPSFVHNYDSNVYIILNEDGTASGVSPQLEAFEGTWYVEDNRVFLDSDYYTTVLDVVDENTIYDVNYQGEYVFTTE